MQTVKSYLRRTDSKYNRNFVLQLAATSTGRIKALAASLLPAFLDASLTKTAIVCNPAAVEDIVTEFREFDIELNEVDSLEDSFLGRP